MLEERWRGEAAIVGDGGGWSRRGAAKNGTVVAVDRDKDKAARRGDSGLG